MRRLYQAWQTIVILLLLSLSACTEKPQATEKELLVFAASSLTDALTEMAAAYEAAHPGTTVHLNFGASSQLAVQIEEGARADLFASANEAQMARLVAAGRVSPESPHPFASNHLVLVTPATQPVVTSLADLAHPEVRFVIAGETVPVGQYTRQALALMAQSGDFPPGFEQSVLANVRSEESNVRQLLAKVQLGEADAAFVYRSDITPAVQAQVHIIPISEAYHVRASYLIAVVNEAPQAAEAATFLAFVQSAEGQGILQAWGFLPP